MGLVGLLLYIQLESHSLCKSVLHKRIFLKCCQCKGRSRIFKTALKRHILFMLNTMVRELSLWPHQWLEDGATAESSPSTPSLKRPWFQQEQCVTAMARDVRSSFVVFYWYYKPLPNTITIKRQNIHLLLTVAAVTCGSTI